MQTIFLLPWLCELCVITDVKEEAQRPNQCGKLFHNPVFSYEKAQKEFNRRCKESHMSRATAAGFHWCSTIIEWKVPINREVCIEILEIYVTINVAFFSPEVCSYFSRIGTDLILCDFSLSVCLTCLACLHFRSVTHWKCTERYKRQETNKQPWTVKQLGSCIQQEWALTLWKLQQLVSPIPSPIKSL